ncbi:MAG: Asp-tRNA(Asn)/Glu-tRNA(Gln) amidotransferase subunit GatB [Planctomycetaceae bacterium]|jgi:aspartyl-tRNA(Asn)/glutamyl-tRNA(Gln) amidotransferase subunit B|nr:Asp-tRNA(Asn)/Glu-tRNA(Gln) amidotransferase subunit GatB [Planctomycetaceae bacterium]
MMNYKIVIGLEVHVQLLTQTKLFTACTTEFNPDAPNTQTQPLCIALPGTLPVLNRHAYELAVKAALGLNCSIAKFTKWDRKQYFYPDLPKGYQISQFDMPMSFDGWLEVDDADGHKKKIRILRAHLEEDAGKNIHDESGRGEDSKVDLNRAGTPLLEIVSEPDLSSAAEARQYLDELRLIMQYLEVSDCNMQEGSLRCDANVNLHIVQDDGQIAPTPLVEVKNLNSFRNVEAAIEVEVERQLEEYDLTGRKWGDPGVMKETRGFDAKRGTTFAQRGKEDAADYRYFPDPDLAPVTITDEEIEAIRNILCELPADRRERMRTVYELSDYDSEVIINHSPQLSDYFEETAKISGDGKQAANWVTQDVLRELNDRDLAIAEFPIRAVVLGAMVKKIVDGDLTVKSGREVFGALLENGLDGGSLSPATVAQIIKDKGLAVVKNTGAIEATIKEVLSRDQNAKSVEDLKGGKQQAAGPIIGQVMKEVKGADAKMVREMILKIVQDS